MGGCLSSAASQSAAEQPTANVISVSGDLREYTIPFTVSQVLNIEASYSSSSCFVCNSDSLYYDDYIPALDPGHQLQAGQIYFVLPSSKLPYRLSASDMAALAVKASVALQKGGSRKGKAHRSKKEARISPVLDVNQRVSDSNSNWEGEFDSNGVAKKSFERPAALGVSRSGSVRKVQRYSSRRAKQATKLGLKLRWGKGKVGTRSEKEWPHPRRKP
ncbi:hypothetical protein F0562_017934 [Nyssa sinensis]|uniref:Uncharacterized protein n=1 Tax=Nyssa sinensis TaxID=561372 RepID=A0A5J4Z840_9ASTE|nr:hypothetical protein F0562_017934 [Nyssa sinensis]